jgi:hypothetical protein
MNLKFSESDENHYSEPRRRAIEGAQCPKLQFHCVQENKFSCSLIPSLSQNLDNNLTKRYCL